MDNSSIAVRCSQFQKHRFEKFLESDSLRTRPLQAGAVFSTHPYKSTSEERRDLAGEKGLGIGLELSRQGLPSSAWKAMDRRLDFGLRVLTVALTAAAGVAAFRADYGPNSNAISDVRTDY